MIKKRSFVKVILLINIVALISGFFLFFYKNIDCTSLINDFFNKSTSINQSIILHNTILILLSFILSLSIFGIVFIYIALLLESLSIGFTLAMFIKYYKIKGLIFYLLFFLVFKFMFLFLFIYFLIMSTKFSSRFLTTIIKKNELGFIRYVKNHFIRFIIVLFLVLIYSVIIKYYSVVISLILLKIIQ